MRLAKAIILLDTRRSKIDGTYPVKLRITFERKQQYYPTPYNLTAVGFKKIMFAERLTEKEKATKKIIQAFEDKAVNIIENLPFFSWKSFEKLYLKDRSLKDTINQAFLDYSSELREAGQIGTAVSYECAINSLNKFAPMSAFKDINPEFLKNYERWMLDNKKSITTISMYLRSLRAICNIALNEGLISKEYYPFGKRKYEIPSSKNLKKALTLKDIAKIYNFKTVRGTNEERAKDFWIFLYLGNGMNVKDMSLLTYSSIKGDILEFIRAKTVRTKRKVEPIRVVLTDDLKAIIKKWGNKNKDANNYIFPILEKGSSPERERQLIQQLTGVINDHMKAIAKKLGIEQDVTTYAARHSFSTVLQRSGVSTEFISEALGHSNVKTTANYLAGFEDESKKEHAKALTAFLKT